MEEKKQPPVLPSVEHYRQIIAKTAEAAKSRLAAMHKHIPTTPQAFGFYAELAACVKMGFAPWFLLPKELRKTINDGEHPRDQGIDGVSSEFDYMQCKCYAPGRNVGKDAVHSLLAITDGLKHSGALPVRDRVFALQKGTKICEGVARRREIKSVYFTTAELKEVGKEALASVPDPKSAYTPEVIAEMKKVQKECADVMWKLRASKTKISARLPTGTGKSFIIRDLALRHLKASKLPVLVIEPRVDIVEEMRALLESDEHTVCVLKAGYKWKDDSDVYLMCDMSYEKLHRTGFSAVFHDEAHLNNFDKILHKLDGLAEKVPIYRFSASIPKSEADYYLSQAEAVKKGIVCDAKFVIAAFGSLQNLLI